MHLWNCQGLGHLPVLLTYCASLPFLPAIWPFGFIDNKGKSGAFKPFVIYLHKKGFSSPWWSDLETLMLDGPVLLGEFC